MKILYLINKEPEGTLKKIMDVHKSGNQMTVVNIAKDKDYARIVDLIFSNDKVISWQ